MKRYICALFICFGVSSCTDNSQSVLTLKKQFVLERKCGASPYFLTQYFWSEGSDKAFIVGNYNKSNKLFIHELETGKLVKEIVLPSKHIRGFYYNEDKIYYCPRYDAKLLSLEVGENHVDTLINIDLSYIKKCILDSINLGMNVEFQVGKGMSLIVSEDKILIPNAYLSNLKPGNSKRLFVFEKKEDSLHVSSDFCKDTLRNKPTETMSPFDVVFSYTLNNESNILVSYAYNHNLYISNYNGKDTVIECKSKYIRNLPKSIEKEKLASNDVYFKRIIEESCYWGLYYDKYRDIYYRTVKHSTHYKKGIDLVNCPFSVMVLDASFNIINETKFDENKYSISDLVITRKGILLKQIEDTTNFTKYDFYEVNI